MSTIKHLIAVVVLVTATGGLARAEGDLPPMQLFDDAPSAAQLERSRPTAAELRQARALEQHRQRVARMEANAWAGYSPLRPTVPANPYTQSRAVYVRPYSIWSVWDLAQLP